MSFKRITLTLCGLIMLFGLFLVPDLAYSTTTDTNDCSLCHGTKADFSTQLIDRNVCKTCHYITHGKANPRQGGVSTPYGYFATAESANADATWAHNVHAGINGYAGDPSCNQCHGAVNCSTCHTQTPHVLHSSTTEAPVNMQVADGVTFSFQPVTCATSNCHGTMPKVATARTDGTQLCLNCHATDRNGHGDLAVKHTASPMTNATSDLDCATCHISTFDGAHTRTAEQNGTNCSLCHGTTADPIALEGINKLRNGEPRTCDLCHDNTVRHNSYPGSHVTDFGPEAQTMDCTSCHSGDLRTQHMVAGSNDPNTSCKRCHEYNGTRLDKSVVMNAITTNNTNCNACHSIHSSVETIHDFSAKFVPNNTTPGCTSCHSGSLDVEHSFNMMTNTNRTINDGDYAGQTINGTSESCKLCHNSSTSARSQEVSSVVQATGDKYCTSCHTLHNDDQIHTVSAPFVAGETINCADCHKSTLQTEHADWGVGCNKCHGDTNLQAGFDPAVVANAVATGAKNCDACHTEVRLPKPVHSTANHNGTFPVYFINCKTCHTNQLDVEHAKWAPAGSMQNYDCSVCHQSDKAEVKNAIATGNRDCIACHTSIHPEEQYRPKHDGIFPKPENLAHYDNCTTCHYENLLTDHAKTPDPGLEVGCTGCHDSTDPARQQAIASLNTNCAGCHTNIHSADVQRHATQFMTTPPFSCNECHQEAATKGLVEEHLTRTDGSGNAYSCATCHKSTKKLVTQAIANKATNCDACHTIHGDVATVHIMDDAVAGKAWPKEPAINCSECHNASITDEHASRTDDAGNAYNCATCHNSTDPLVKQAIQDKVITCTACHGPVHSTVETQHQGDFIVKEGYNCADCHSATTTEPIKGQLIPIHEKLGCQVCHSSTVSETVKTAVTTGNANCSACHGDATTVHANDATKHQSGFATNAAGCSDCHDNQLEVIHTGTTQAGVAMNCNTCHESQLTNVKQAISDKNRNCDACHTVHANMVEAHTVPIDAMVPSGQLACKDCHNNYLPDEHLKAATTTTVNSTIGYEVFRSTSATTGFTKVGNIVGTSYSDGTLSPSTTYYYQVRAYDVAGNMSGFSNTVSAITPATPPASKKVNPTSAYYCEGNGDSSNDNNKSNALSALTNNRDSTSSSDSYQIREDGWSNDRYVWVRLDNTDAKDYKAVKLELKFRWYNDDSSGNILVYPYQSDGKNINTSSVVNYKMSNLNDNNWVTHTIDVTTAAKTMNNFGWMKFRIKPGSDGREERAYLSEVRIITENDATSETGTTTTDSTIASNPTNGDTTAPSAPSGLTAAAVKSVQIDLNWTASTDVGPTPTNNGTCTLCHSSTARQQVKDAVAASKITCDSCHTIHSDVTTEHTVSSFPSYVKVNCAQCHTKVVSTEHTSRQDNTGVSYTCNTCHSSTREDVKTAISSGPAGLDCSKCHQSTTHSDYAIEHKTTNSDCLRCHDEYQQIDRHRNGCNTCHGSSISSTVNNAVLAQDTNCVTCHGNKHGSWGSGGGSWGR